MHIADETLEQLRNCSKDENAYHQLVALFEREILQASSQKLRQSEANMRAMLNSTWHSFTLIDRHHKVVDTNEKSKQSAEAVFGKPILAGDSIYDFVLPRDHASFTANFSQALQGETIVLEKTFPLPGGKQACFEIAYYPVIDGNEVIGVCMSHHDITKRKQAEDRLSRYKNIISSTQDGIYLVNRDYVYEIVNDAYLARTYLNLEQIEGHSISEVMGENVFQRVIKPYFDRCLTGETIAYSEWFDFPSLGRRYMSVTYFPYYSENGVIEGVIVNSHDITDQKQSQNYLQAILNSSLNGIMAFESVRTDAGQIVDFQWTLVNHRAEQIVGRSQSNLLKKHLLVEMPGNREDGLFDLYVAVVETGHPLDHKHYYDHDNLKTWFHTTAVKLEDGFVVTFADISQQKQIEDALRRQRDELDRFFSVALDLLCIMDTNGNFIKANTAWETTLGYPIGTLEERHFLDFVHPDDLGPTLEMFAQLDRQQQVVNFVNRIHTQDGSIRFIEWRSHPYGNLIYAAARDITDRKRMEETLRHSELKYRSLAENSADGLVIWDALQKQVIYTSPGFERQLGQEPGTGTGMTEEDVFRLWHPDDLDAVLLQLYKATEFKSNSVIFTIRARHHDGHYIWQENHLTLQYGPDGIYQTGYMVSRDITERKRAQERDLELGLERERRKLLTAFIQNAAHEFRTPLSAISSSIYLMSRYEDTDRRNQKAEQIALQIKLMSRLVDSLLLMTRLNSEDLWVTNRINLSSIMRSACEKAANNCARSHNFRYEIAPDLPLMMGNMDYLSHALNELLDNACRFTPAGGQITVNAFSEGKHIWIEVRDNGPGISSEVLPHIFETFWRQDTAHSTPGFGLGLPIAQKIIQQHGGELTVVSEEGQGANFRVTLPVYSEE